MKTMEFPVTGAQRPVPSSRLPELVRPARGADMAAARASLRTQIARLERELGSLALSPWPRRPPEHGVASSAGPRMLTLGDLEDLRDRMAARVASAREELEERGRAQEELYARREEMLLDPKRHTWARVTNEDLGEPGCRSCHVRPRAGLLGMLMGWWRVVISSGCP